MLGRLLVASALFGFAGTLFAQNASSANPLNNRPAQNQFSPSPQQQFIPYWTADPGWHTDLMLRNNLESGNLLVTPVLRLTDGSEVTLPTVTIASGTVAQVNLRQALTQSHPDVLNMANPYGSAVLEYTSLSNGNLYASAMIHDDGHPVIFHLDGVYQVSDYGRGSREGIWWLPKETTKGYLVLTNLSDTEQNGTLWLYDPAGASWKQAITLPAKQMVRFPIRDLVSTSGLTGDHGGLSFQMQQGAGSVSSALVLFDESAGFSANMKMFDWDPSTTLHSHDYARAGKWITRASMLALENPDPALQLPSGTMLHPEIFLRNSTNRPVNAQLSFHWRKDSENGRVPLPEMSLAANETRIVDVKHLQDTGAIPSDAYWSQVTITTNTLPGEVMAVASSFDDTLRYGAQTPFSDQLSAHLEGGAWQVDANHDSIIAAGNGSSKPVTANLTFFYAGGTKKYQIVQTIAPDDQMWVDVGELIHDGIPDKDGNLLPSNLTTSAYSLRDVSATPSTSLYEGKLVTDKTYGHATYGCMVCCGYKTALLEPYPVVVLFNGDDDLWVQALEDCGGLFVNVDAYAATWTSLNPSIISMRPELAHGVAVGSTTLDVGLDNIDYGPVRDGQSCPLMNITVQGGGSVIHLAGFQITVVNSAPSGTLNSVISKVSNQIKVTAVDPTGATLTNYNGTVSISSTDTQATLPGNYTFTSADAGSHTFNITLVTVNFTSSTRDLTAKDTSNGISSTDNIYVWFNVIASDEGLVGGTTAYGHVITPDDHFIALPSTGLNSVPVVLMRNSIQQSTKVLDVGPWCPNSVATKGNPCVCASDPYWSTSGVPFAATNSCSSDHAGIDLADGTFAGLGLSGNGNIYWRFQ